MDQIVEDDPMIDLVKLHPFGLVVLDSNPGRIVRCYDNETEE